jgi:hypothetical protein
MTDREIKRAAKARRLTEQSDRMNARRMRTVHTGRATGNVRQFG